MGLSAWFQCNRSASNTKLRSTPSFLIRTLAQILALSSLGAVASALGQTPTLVQQYYSGSNSPVRGLNAATYTFRLPNRALAGNCLVMFIDHPHGAAITSITDDGGNQWPTSAAVSADRGNGSAASAAYVLPNVSSGTRVITVTFSAATAGIHASFLEYYNVVTSAPVASIAVSTTAASPSVSSGVLAPSTPVSGDLVLNYAVDNVGDIGSQSSTAVTAWLPGAGWAMLAGDINNSHDTSSFGIQSRIADGSVLNPTLVGTQRVADTFNSLALELRAARAGTAPAGIHIVKEQFFVDTALNVPGRWTEIFPAQGNLLAAMNIVASSTVANISDSNGNAWQPAHNDPGSPAIQYAQNAATGGGLTVSVPLTGANTNTTLVLFDIAGAATANVLAQAVTVEDTDVSGTSVARGAPVITPRYPNGLILAVAGFGQGPVTGLASGAPTAALFMPVTYPNETDMDTMDNADAYAQTFYGTDLSTESYNWTMQLQPINSWDAAAVEFVAAGATTLPMPPSNLTATVASSTQINLAWIAPSGSAPVSGYFIERCQGAGCASFNQIGSTGGMAYSDASLSPGVSYSYRVGTSSSTGYTNVVTATTSSAPDGTAPSVPSPVAATAVSDSQINVSWGAATDNVGVTSYLLERCLGSGCTNFAQIATPTTTTFSDAGLSSNTMYSYRVRAIDAAHNLGAYSSIALATTGAAVDSAKPTAPGGLVANTISSTQINLAWNPSIDNVGIAGYRVMRCQAADCGNFSQVGASNSTTYADSGVAAAMTYRYRVHAVDAAGNISGNSNTASATTRSGGDATSPTVPVGVTATATGATQISLAWSASTDNVAVANYDVERCQGVGCVNFTQIATPLAPNYLDSGLNTGTNYQYRVRAADSAGNLSGYSAIVGLSTSASAGAGASAAISFVQAGVSTPQSPTAVVSVNYPVAQTPGGLNVVVIGWINPAAIVASVTDTSGNQYALAVGPTMQSKNVAQAIYYAKNIISAAAKSNTVTVQFSAPAIYPDLRVLNYSGIDPINPLDVRVGESGNSATSDSGIVTTTTSHELLIAANTVWSLTAGPGSGFTKRVITAPNGDIAEDEIVGSLGSYHATAPLSGSGPWVMQLVSFRAASP